MKRATTPMTALALALVAACNPAGAGAPKLHFVDDPALGAFLDITGIGQLVNLGANGEVMLPGGVFQGNFIFARGGVVVGQNGGLAFGQGTVTDLQPENEPIPSNAAFIGGQSALAFWDDIDDKEGGDAYFVRLEGDPDVSDRLIVQWEEPDFDGLGSTLRFQAHILENPQPTGFYAQFMYEIQGPAASAGASATIGYQDGPAGHGDLQHSFNETGVVVDGTVLTLLIPLPEDVDADGRVGIGDLLMLLAAWGPCADCEEPFSCPADIDGDCAVDLEDLLEVLASWG